MNKNKKPTIFDLVKKITFSKEKWDDIPEEEQKLFNNWMVNKILSMNIDYVELVNYIQKHTWMMKPKHLYMLYSNIIPKSNTYSPYIKNTNKKEYKIEQVKAVSEYFNISTKDAKEYIDMLNTEEVERITAQFNSK